MERAWSDAQDHDRAAVVGDVVVQRAGTGRHCVRPAGDLPVPNPPDGAAIRDPPRGAGERGDAHRAGASRYAVAELSRSPAPFSIRLKFAVGGPPQTKAR